MQSRVPLFSALFGVWNKLMRSLTVTHWTETIWQFTIVWCNVRIISINFLVNIPKAEGERSKHKEFMLAAVFLSVPCCICATCSANFCCMLNAFFFFFNAVVMGNSGYEYLAMEICHVAKEANFAHQFVHVFHKQKRKSVFGCWGRCYKVFIATCFCKSCLANPCGFLQIFSNKHLTTCSTIPLI